VVQWYIGDSLNKNGHGKGKSDEIHFAEMEHPNPYISKVIGSF
jgi:hypothetical protein